MGVRGLQSLIERQCPDAFKLVSVQELANDHQRIQNCIPVLAVDGMAVMRPLYSSCLEFIYGGQWIQFVKKLEHFVASFDSIGIKLVFFFDGTVSAAKRDEWVKRRVAKSQQNEIILSNIKSNNRMLAEKDFQLPTSMGTLTRFAIKELGAEVYQTDRDADEVIAEYANNNKEVFGILSQDTDYIIFNTKLYISMTHLDIATMQSRIYDRNQFSSRYLGLDVRQLPLFACLAGNDTVQSEDLKPFHKQLSRNGRPYLSEFAVELAYLINAKQWSGDWKNRREMEEISMIVFGDVHWFHVLQEGLRSYDIQNVRSKPKLPAGFHPDFEKAAYERHLHCINGPFVYKVLFNMEYESSEVLEDSSRTPSTLIYRQIRQRCYGVLFNSFVAANYDTRRNFRQIVIKEWCAFHGNQMEAPELIEPLPLKQFHQLRIPAPSIETVWFKYSEEEQMMLFWSILEAPMEFEILKRAPKHQIVLICVLNYVIGNCEATLITPLDVAIFIAQALAKKSEDYLYNLKVPQLNINAISLSTLFMRGVTTILMVLGTCGNPFTPAHVMPWNYFDGKLFHYLYAKAGQQPRIASICDKTAEKEFWSILSAATNNTMFDTSHLNWEQIISD